MYAAEFWARNCASRRWFLLLAEPDIHLLSRARGPSQKIEFVFSASLETTQRGPQKIALLCPVPNLQDLAACTLSNSVFSLARGGYAAALLWFSAVTKSR
jgi:hypothetical protein